MIFGGEAPVPYGRGSLLWLGFAFTVGVRLRVYPLGCSVGPVFLFPNRDAFFERVDQPLAGGEGCAAVGAGGDDGDRGLAERDAAEAVDDRALDELPALAGFGFEGGEFFEGHFLVGVVVEFGRFAASRELPSNAEEQQHGPCLRRLRTGEQWGSIEWFLGQFGHVSFYVAITFM